MSLLLSDGPIQYSLDSSSGHLLALLGTEGQFHSCRAVIAIVDIVQKFGALSGSMLIIAVLFGGFLHNYDSFSARAPAPAQFNVGEGGV